MKIDPAQREQLESHLIEFAEMYSPWAVLLIATAVLKPMFGEQVKADDPRTKKGRDKSLESSACPLCGGLDATCECSPPTISDAERTRRVELIKGHLSREDRLLAVLEQSQAQCERLLAKAGMLSDAAWSAIENVRNGSTAAAINDLDEALRKSAT